MKPCLHSRGADRLATLVAALGIVLTAAAPRALAQATPKPPERMTYQGFLVDGTGTALGNSAPKNYDVIFRIYDDQSAGTLLWSEQQTVTVDKGYFSVLLGEGAAVGIEAHPVLSNVFKGATASDRYVGVTVKGIGSSGADVNILPRLRLISSPYAFLAHNAVRVVQDTGADLITAVGNAVTVSGPVSATTFTGNGAALTALNASQITSGTLADARLTANVAKLDASSQTFSGSLTVGGNLTVNSPSTLSGFGTVPLGGIILWSGAINQIPAGWALCNGQTSNGRTTPNLQDRFVVGAGSAYGVGNVGGAASVTLTVDQIPSHTHGYADGFFIEAYTQSSWFDE
ncbi:MAG: tail fiber protein, partial [Verrucomicrobiales bacterium]|nr:tail fiber protein [Verrucomicrobiales bacterium]